jgi:hypothetical protein
LRILDIDDFVVEKPKFKKLTTLSHLSHRKSIISNVKTEPVIVIKNPAARQTVKRKPFVAMFDEDVQVISVKRNRKSVDRYDPNVIAPQQLSTLTPPSKKTSTKRASYSDVESSTSERLHLHSKRKRSSVERYDPTVDGKFATARKLGPIPAKIKAVSVSIPKRTTLSRPTVVIPKIGSINSVPATQVKKATLMGGKKGNEVKLHNMDKLSFDLLQSVLVVRKHEFVNPKVSVTEDDFALVADFQENHMEFWDLMKKKELISAATCKSY